MTKKDFEDWKLIPGARWTYMDIRKDRFGSTENEMWLVFTEKEVPLLVHADTDSILISIDELASEPAEWKLNSFTEASKFEIMVLTKPTDRVYIKWINVGGE